MTCDVTEFKAGKKYKLIPPDGGWGYMIWISTIILISIAQSIVSCFGLIFKDFMKELKMSSTSVAIMNGLNGIFVAVAGYTTGPLSGVLSWRQLCLLASVLMTASSVGCYFAQSEIAFFIFQAIQCTSVGYFFNISYTQINDYFLEKRLLSMSFTQTIIGLIAIVAPIFFKWSLEEYGFRGTLLLIIAITLQNFIASIMLQPVEWHLKKVPIADDEGEVNLLVKSAIKKTEDLKTAGTAEESEVAHKIRDKKSHTHDPESPVVKNPKRTMQKISDALDLSLFKSVAVLSATLGTAIALFGEVTFGVMLPQALYFVRWKPSAVEWAMSLMSIGDVAAKLSLMIFNKWLIKLGYRNLYMIGLFIAIVTRIGMIWSKKQMTTMIFLTLMGASKCILATLMPLVLSEIVSQEKYANVLGMYMLVYCILSLTIGPLVGAVRDMTNSYATSFCVSTSLYAIVLMFWSIEMCYMRNQKKLQRQKLKPKRTVRAK